jgi:hypothetical protein
MTGYSLAKVPHALALVCLATLSSRGLARAEEKSTEIDALGLQQVQVIGTHNSYHVRKQPANGRAGDWNYSHAPLDVQLDRGVRSLELDLHWKNGEFEVFHVPLVDEGTTCRRLADALATVRKWSDAHPRHVPISFLFELKKEGPGLDKRIKEVDSAGLDQLDELLKSAFPPAKLISPDDVRAGATTLREAVEKHGWPKLADARGKVLFILHDDGAKRDLYLRDHPSLAGRAMFVRSSPDRDDAAALVMDSPRDDDIGRLAKAGYLIRTRADADLRGDLAAKVARRDRALASGAHILSTDFPHGEAQEDTGYVVEFSGDAPARANPVNAPAELAGQLVGE